MPEFWSESVNKTRGEGKLWDFSKVESEIKTFHVLIGELNWNEQFSIVFYV